MRSVAERDEEGWPLPAVVVEVRIWWRISVVSEEIGGFIENKKFDREKCCYSIISYSLTKPGVLWYDWIVLTSTKVYNQPSRVSLPCIVLRQTNERLRFGRLGGIMSVSPDSVLLGRAQRDRHLIAVFVGVRNEAYCAIEDEDREEISGKLEALRRQAATLDVLDDSNLRSRQYKRGERWVQLWLTHYLAEESCDEADRWSGELANMPSIIDKMYRHWWLCYQLSKYHSVFDRRNLANTILDEDYHPVTNLFALLMLGRLERQQGKMGIARSFHKLVLKGVSSKVEAHLIRTIAVRELFEMMNN